MTDGRTDEISNRQKTNRNGKKMEKMMTEGGQQKDTGDGWTKFQTDRKGRKMDDRQRTEERHRDGQTKF